MSDLHGKIMNIQISKNANQLRKEIAPMDGDALMIAYKIGHRDAKHAAAELSILSQIEHEELFSAAKAVITCHDEDIGMDEFGDDESVGSETDDTGAIVDMPMTFGMLRRLRSAIANAEKSSV